jgi:hypothetical protein
MGVLIRAKATSQILTLAHRCGVRNERLLIRRRVEMGEWAETLAKAFILLSADPLCELTVRRGERHRRR